MIRSSLRTATLISLMSATALVVPFAAAKPADAPPAPNAGDAPPVPATGAVAGVEAGTVSDIDTDVAIPVRKGGKGGGASPYKAKLDALEIGQSIHVAGKVKRQLNSTMHTLNKAYRAPELDAAGQPVTEVKIGKKKDGTETRKTVAKYTETRKFEHYDAAADDKRGPGVRIFRVK